ncbi:MAG: mycofactocin-associated electron transfer flavoprotein alpha subunit [Streptosporangiaceae bacterium]
MTLAADVKILAVVVVRDGQLPAGAAETVAEAGGAALIAGSGTGKAADGLDAASRVWLLEMSTVAPAALASTLAPALAGVDMILLPASPDGRDLAPRLAVILGRPLLAGAVRCAPGEVEVTRLDDRLSVRIGVDGPVLVTLRPGLASKHEPAQPAQVSMLSLAPPPPCRDAESVEVLQPEPGVVDLAEARRIAGGGAGLVPAGADGAAVMRLLADVGAALGASAGATRVVTDAGWMSYDRQIGTTGVSVNPELYIAFGISGAAQHVGGLGAPEHVVSVNTDPSCPMTAMADLGIVADAPAVLSELAKQLGVTRPSAGPQAQREGASHGG